MRCAFVMLESNLPRETNSVQVLMELTDVVERRTRVSQPTLVVVENNTIILNSLLGASNQKLFPIVSNGPKPTYILSHVQMQSNLTVPDSLFLRCSTLWN